jgi:glycosylphosphatidylinositol transamidase
MWDVVQWGALIPKEIGLSTSPYNLSQHFFRRLCLIYRANLSIHAVYRTNTFPLIHAGFFHAFMNVLALTPLLERFEAEYGTLTTLALFLGRMCTPCSQGFYTGWQMC